MDYIYFVFETSLLFVCLPVSMFCLGFIWFGWAAWRPFCFCCLLLLCCVLLLCWHHCQHCQLCQSIWWWVVWHTGLFAIGQQLGQWDCSIQVMMSSDSSLLLLSHWLSSVLVVFSSCGCTTHFLFHEACREVRHHAVLRLSYYGWNRTLYFLKHTGFSCFHAHVLLLLSQWTKL